MSKKNKKDAPQEDFKPAEYYKLKTKAVDDLVNADVSNSPKVSEAELRKYRSGIIKRRVPDWVKFVLIKWWFAAAVCFFFLWGLGNYLTAMLDRLFVTAIALGIVTDILTNNALRFFETVPGSASGWVMFYKKRYATFPLNILYAFAVLFIVFMVYNVLNSVIITVGHLTDVIPLTVEPIMFGLFYLGADMLLVTIRNAFRKAIADAKKPLK